MDKHGLEEYLHERLKDQKEMIDKDALWASLDLDKPKRRLPLFLISLLLVCVIGLLVGDMYWNDLFPDRKQSSQIHQESLIYQDEDEKKSPIDEQTNKSEAYPTQASEKTELKVSPSNNKNDGPIKKEKQHSTQNIENNKARKSANISQTESTILTTAENLNKKTKARRKTNSSLNNAAINPSDNKINARNSSSSNTSSKQIISTQIVTNQQENIDTKKRKRSFTKINIKNLNFLPFASLILDRIRDNKMNEKLAATQNLRDKNKAYAVQVYGGTHFVKRDLTASDPALLEHIRMRNNSESSLEMMSVGGALKYNLNNGLYLKAGVEYQSINEQFNISYTTDSLFWRDNETTSILISSAGDTTVTSTGQAQIAQTKTELWENYNSHRLINVSLSIGYQKYFGRFGVVAEATPFVTLYRRFNGLMLDPSMGLTEKPGYFNQSVSFGYRIAAGVSYKWNPNVSIYVTPSYQGMIGSFTTDVSNISQRYSMTGLQLGLEYRL